MRITAGQFKGKKLSAGSDLSIRPITNRLKEIIFSVLSDFFYDKTVLDLFSGSGSLGLESLSRGAGQVTFVEKEDSSLRILKNNIDTLGVNPDLIQIEIIQDEDTKKINGIIIIKVKADDVHLGRIPFESVPT